MGNSVTHRNLDPLGPRAPLLPPPPPPPAPQGARPPRPPRAPQDRRPCPPAVGPLQNGAVFLLGEELLIGGGHLAVMEAGPGQALGLIGLDEVGQLVDLLPGKSAAWPSTLMSRTEPPSATGPENTPKPQSFTMSLMSLISKPKRRSGLSEPKRSMASRQGIRRKGSARPRPAPP